MKLIIDISDERYERIIKDAQERIYTTSDLFELIDILKNGTPLTPNVLAYALMEERIRGEFNTDTTFEKDIIHDVKCRLTVSIIDHRPCYCGAELREVWRESE